MGVQFLTCIREQPVLNISRLGLLLMVHVLYFSYSRRMLELITSSCSLSFTETVNLRQITYATSDSYTKDED